MNITPVEKRFNNELGRNYDIAIQGIPHYWECLNEVFKEIEKELQSNDDILYVLDLGSGSGNLVSLLGENLMRMFYTAVDHDPQMIERFRSKFLNSGVHLANADILEFLVSLPSHSVDLIVNTWTFHNWQIGYRKKVFKEVYRVLKNGGKLIMVDKITSQDEIQHQSSLYWQLNFINEIFRGDLKLMNAYIEHYLVDDTHEIRFTEHELYNLIQTVGFVSNSILARRMLELICVITK
jgi:ubiquinone/menaquinone biosynthesis C-methylase UbiE